MLLRHKTQRVYLVFAGYISLKVTYLTGACRILKSNLTIGRWVCQNTYCGTQPQARPEHS